MEEEVYEVVKFERIKHLAVLNYLLNKNSHPLPKGVDYEKMFDELQDYERYLHEML